MRIKKIQRHPFSLYGILEITYQIKKKTSRRRAYRGVTIGIAAGYATGPRPDKRAPGPRDRELRSNITFLYLSRGASAD